jgi:hypothetical protein
MRRGSEAFCRTLVALVSLDVCIDVTVFDGLGTARTLNTRIGDDRNL